MSASKRSSPSALRKINAPIFAALGDETRLTLVHQLCESSPQSISELTNGSDLTRQAITKHLQTLEDVGIVKSFRKGRLTLYKFEASPLINVHEYLENVAKQWDDALVRLKNFVE